MGCIIYKYFLPFYGLCHFVYDNHQKEFHDLLKKFVPTERKYYKELENYQFEYAHNSYLVNLKYVTRLFSQGYIQLRDGTELNVSRSKMWNFRNALIGMLGSKYDYKEIL